MNLIQDCVDWFVYNYSPIRIYKITRWKDQNETIDQPDLFIMRANNGCHGLFVKIDIGTNVETEKNVGFEYHATEENYIYSVCHSLDEFKVEVEYYFKTK